MSVKFSVIFPVYNTEPFLEQAINSVIDQSIKDWELIAINDASTDNSLRLLRSLANQEPRIRIINLKDNHGPGQVRNLAMAQAKGSYLIFLDSDDFLAVGAFANVVELLNLHHETEVLVWGFNRCSEKGSILKSYLPIKPNLSRGETPFLLSLLGRSGFHSFAWIYIVKRELVRRYGLHFAVNRFFEDIQFSTQLLYYAKKITIVNKLCYNYRKHDVSITAKSSKQKIDDKFSAFIGIKDFLKEKKVFHKYEGLFLARFLALCVHTCFNEYFMLSKDERDEELDNYMYKIRKSKLLRSENLRLLRNIGLSVSKNESNVRQAYLGAYYGLKSLKKWYLFHRLRIRIIGWIYRKKSNLN